MVVVFGWGQGEVLDRGPVVPVVCPNCHNQVDLHEIRSQKQVSLYFVPLASYGSDEYLACPICRHGVEVQPQHRSAVDAMVAATRMVRTGQLAPEAYQAQAQRFLAQIGIVSLEVPAGLAPAAGPASGGTTASTALPASTSGQTPALADRLARLGELHADGMLTDDEFTAAKRRILQG